MTYLNSGDWVESLTSLEYQNGVWDIYKFDASQFTKEDDDTQDIENLNDMLDVKELFEKFKQEVV